MAKVNVKWTNKYSGEQGYVGAIRKNEGHFINASEKSDARVFLNESMARNAIDTLDEIGETSNNDFELEDV